ncbi:hypothetical protein O3M35_002573 [Rhynocoris fuscipes]|uniref:Uncharacterized protein n=1 Tax=Rhynocoris fuscipes TaxID=488301 RepID=A0AAW1CMJ2_9HEMI
MSSNLTTYFLLIKIIVFFNLTYDMMTRQKFYIETGVQGSHVLATSDFFFFFFF